jgi:NAD(P)-dependent dehydrogenase (short-subunit alcohol dehydrogenase family)
MPVPADALDEKSLLQARDQVLQQWGRIDILINAAGGNSPDATVFGDVTFFNLKREAVQKMLDLNLMGTILPSQVFGEVMAKAGKGSIINISSMAAQRPLTRVIGYAAAKSAIDNFTRWLAVDLATKHGEGLRVNAIAPGFFIGEQNRAFLINADGTPTPRGETIIAHTPMKRFGEADELIGAAVWLCSDAAKFVTGIVVPVDGGFSAFGGV